MFFSSRFQRLDRDFRFLVVVFKPRSRFLFFTRRFQNLDRDFCFSVVVFKYSIETFVFSIVVFKTSIEIFVFIYVVYKNLIEIFVFSIVVFENPIKIFVFQSSFIRTRSRFWFSIVMMGCQFKKSSFSKTRLRLLFTDRIIYAAQGGRYFKTGSEEKFVGAGAGGQRVI